MLTQINVTTKEEEEKFKELQIRINELNSEIYLANQYTEVLVDLCESLDQYISVSNNIEDEISIRLCAKSLVLLEYANKLNEKVAHCYDLTLISLEMKKI